MKLYFFAYRCKFFVSDMCRFARAVWNGQITIDRDGVVTGPDFIVTGR